MVDNPGTSFLVDSDKVVGIDSSCFSGDVELKIEGFEYGGAVSKNPVKFECIIKGTSYSTNSSVLVGIENDPLPLLGLAKATKKVVGRIVAQKGNTSDFISRKFVIEKGPTDLNSDQLMTANAVRGYVDENTIKVRDFGEFTLTTEKNHIGFPILKYIWGDPYPYNEFILTFWTNKNEFYKCWGVNVSNSINSKIAVQKLGSDLGENELRIHVMPTGQYEINSGKYYASVGIQNKHLAENGITTLSHVRLMSKELDLPDEIDFDMYSISPAGLDTGSTIPKDIAS